ncbi:hypothetical protein [Qipengyuania sp. JC766]|uniref:hypothetical protein n=1 Tax=Qipengyuania sp. JC766 TaxID=3232139 RepID=UPI003457C58C
MFIGHFAPALAAAALSRRAPKLATLFVAAQLVDWAFFALGLAGIESMRITPGASAMNPLELVHLPYTHSLAGTAAWATAFGLGTAIVFREALAGLLAGCVVLSHWFLDLLVHVPDLTLAGGDDRLGLGLWNFPWIAIPLELALIIAAFAFFLRRTKGPVGPPLVLMGVMLALQAYAWFGPEPASVTAFYVSGILAFGIITLLAKWAGDTRWHKRHASLTFSTT